MAALGTETLIQLPNKTQVWYLQLDTHTHIHAHRCTGLILPQSSYNSANWCAIEAQQHRNRIFTGPYQLSPENAKACEAHCWLSHALNSSENSDSLIAGCWNVLGWALCYSKPLCWLVSLLAVDVCARFNKKILKKNVRNTYIWGTLSGLRRINESFPLWTSCCAYPVAVSNGGAMLILTYQV